MQKLAHISDNITITAEVEKQHRDGVSRADVKISLRLARIRELHAKWIHFSKVRLNKA